LSASSTIGYAAAPGPTTTGSKTGFLLLYEKKNVRDSPAWVSSRVLRKKIEGVHDVLSGFPKNEYALKDVFLYRGIVKYCAFTTLNNFSGTGFC
jgi:hypothetical protein